MKINLGAGEDILSGFVNHDIVPLKGIDIVHDLNRFPWPWPDNSAKEIKVYDVLEHLNEFIKAMEEIHRILRFGGRCFISVPYWNSWCSYSDPTHKKTFHETAFYFFDKNSPYCKKRPYYTKARFKIIKETFILAPFSPYFSVFGKKEITISNASLKKIIGLTGNYFINNLIHGIRIVLEKEAEKK